MNVYKRPFRILRYKGSPSRAFRHGLALRIEGEMYRQGYQRMGFMRIIAVPITVTVIFLATGTGAYVYASPSIMLNHPLYPVKQGIEGMEARLATTPEERARYNLKMANRRLSEGEEYLIRHELPPELVAQIDGYLEESLVEASRVALSTRSRAEMVERLSMQQERYEKLLELAQNKQLIPIVLTAHSNDGVVQSQEAAFIVMESPRIKQAPLDQEVMTWDMRLLQADTAMPERNKQEFMRVWIDESKLPPEEKQSLLRLVDEQSMTLLEAEVVP